MRVSGTFEADSDSVGDFTAANVTFSCPWAGCRIRDVRRASDHAAEIDAAVVVLVVRTKHRDRIEKRRLDFQRDAAPLYAGDEVEPEIA